MAIRLNTPKLTCLFLGFSHIYCKGTQGLKNSFGGAGGAVVFDAIEFDTVGTYKYKIYESDADKIGGFTYDGSFAVVYNYSISDSAAGKLIFTNSYTAPTPPAEPTPAPEIPKTGDNTNIILWIALLFVSGGTVTGLGIYRSKKRES